ncbi:MAG: protein-L-isoaspartate(D-aspartate) O-methyltransferase [Acidobacteriia bacterium]|nr:protein-L-isoaspartate(D-aspartate) O-methyltransferase [Terriglobia bacterium]
MYQQRQTGFTARRTHMVDKQLIARGIRDARLLAAIGLIPREEFLHSENRPRSYRDEPVPIGCGQTLSQPYMTALMVECLGLRGDENVLEVGAGCGYHAALLGCMAASVVSIELVPELAELARENLRRTGYSRNVTIVCGDGSAGWPERAAFDAISVAAGAPAVPQALLDQLADGGRLVIPVGQRKDQHLLLIERQGGQYLTRTITGCRFVPLLGAHGWSE